MMPQQHVPHRVHQATSCGNHATDLCTCMPTGETAVHRNPRNGLAAPLDDLANGEFEPDSREKLARRFAQVNRKYP